MFRRRGLSLLLAICFFGVIGVLHAENRVLAEVRFVAHSSAEKNAGVWVDGQYVGFVKELNGDKKMLLLPGKHEIVVRQAWYKDYVEQALLEPGEVHTVNLSLEREGNAPHPRTASSTYRFAWLPAVRDRTERACSSEAQNSDRTCQGKYQRSRHPGHRRVKGQAGALGKLTFFIAVSPKVGVVFGANR